MQLTLLRIAAFAATAVALPQAWEGWEPSSSITSSKTTSTSFSTSKTKPTTSTISGGASWDPWYALNTTTSSRTTSTSTASVGSWEQWSTLGGGSRGGSGPGYSSGSSTGSGSPGPGSGFGSGSSGSSGSSGWSGQPAFYSAPVPTATLSPTTHWSHKPADPAHLVPSDSNQIYYATDGNSSPKVSHQMAWLTANYTSEAVILDHSSLLTYTYDTTSSNVVIAFKSSVAYQTAQQEWSSDSDLLFVVHDSSCTQGGSCYLKATSLNFVQSSFTCTASCSSIGFEQAVSYFDFEWGTYRPGKKAPLPSSGSSGAGGASTGQSTTGSGSPSGSGTGSSSGSGLGLGSGTTTSTPTAPYPTATLPSNGTSVNGTISGNFTDGGSSNLDNCTAAPDTKYGLPTACLGPYFDDDLDDSYGYQDSDETDFSSFMAQFNDLFYPDPLPEDSDDASEDDTDNAELGLEKKWSWIPKILVQAIAKVLPIQGVTTPYTKEIQLMTLPLNVPKQRTTVNSPWGQQVLIKSFSKTSSSNPENSAKLDIYCVDCGLQGQADITGKVGISVLEGISSLGATMKADMAMTLKVGIDAQLVYTQTFNQDLFNVPLSPLCVANVICVGPYLKLGADLTLKANANGQLLAGASITMHNAVASIDVAAFTASASGWQPEFNPTFQANGSIDVSADVGLPLAIALGINILNGKFSKEASIVDRPSIVATAAVAASAGLDPNGQITGGVTATDGCTGIKTTLGLKNQVYVTIPGHSNIMLSDPPALNLKDGCIALPAAPSSNPSATADPNATPTGTDPNAPGTGPTATGDPSTDPNPTTGNDPNTAGSTDPTDIPTVKARSLHALYPRQNSSSSTSGDIIDTTSQTLSNGTTNTTAYVQPDSGDKAYNLTDGYTIATLIDTESRYQILPCSNGNLHLFGINETVPDYQCGDMWTMRQSDEVVVSDGMARIPVFYTDEMSKTGVSRIRLVDVENIPVGAEEIVFIPAETEVSDGDKEELYYPCDKDQTTYYSMVCVYGDGSPSKMFLAGDVNSGLDVLQSADVKYSITGGEVKECYYLPLIQGMGYDTGEDDGYDTGIDDASTR